jgi:hypothetical protein
MNIICPLMSYRDGVIVICASNCAWYDSTLDRCTIVTMSKEVKYISDRIDDVLERH